jgi:hypothetical protein
VRGSRLDSLDAHAPFRHSRELLHPLPPPAPHLLPPLLALSPTPTELVGFNLFFTVGLTCAYRLNVEQRTALEAMAQRYHNDLALLNGWHAGQGQCPLPRLDAATPVGVSRVGQGWCPPPRMNARCAADGGNGIFTRAPASMPGAPDVPVSRPISFAPRPAHGARSVMAAPPRLGKRKGLDEETVHGDEAWDEFEFANWLNDALLPSSGHEPFVTPDGHRGNAAVGSSCRHLAQSPSNSDGADEVSNDDGGPSSGAATPPKMDEEVPISAPPSPPQAQLAPTNARRLSHTNKGSGRIPLYPILFALCFSQLAIAQHSNSTPAGVYAPSSAFLVLMVLNSAQHSICFRTCRWIWSLMFVFCPLILMVDDNARTRRQLSERLLWLPWLAPIMIVMYGSAGMLHGMMPLQRRMHVRLLGFYTVLCVVRFANYIRLTNEWCMPLFALLLMTVPTAVGYAIQHPA